MPKARRRPAVTPEGEEPDYVNKKVRGGEYILRDNMEFDETPSCKCECKIGDMSEFFFS